MVYVDFPFNYTRDLKPVDQFGFIDLKTALDSASVPSQMPDSDSDYNGAEDPESILGRPRDVFEAIDAQKAIESVAAPSSDEGSKDE